MDAVKQIELRRFQAEALIQISNWHAIFIAATFAAKMPAGSSLYPMEKAPGLSAILATTPACAEISDGGNGPPEIAEVYEPFGLVVAHPMERRSNQK